VGNATNKPMIKLLFVLLLSILFYGCTRLEVNPVIAFVTPSGNNGLLEMVSEKNPDSPVDLVYQNLALPSVKNFLSSIPSDYYTIRQVNAIKTLTKEKQALLVDVREKNEYDSGHIKQAINIPIRTLTDHLQEIPKNRPVILYCSTGYRTAMGVMALQMLGYDNVKGFPPSIEGWKAAGELLE